LGLSGFFLNIFAAFARHKEHRKASVISAQFIFKPGTYDDEFHRLDAEIEAYVATIPGFLGAEKWVSFDGQTKNSMYYFETMDAMYRLSGFEAPYLMN
jgi:hypothetical protein